VEGLGLVKCLDPLYGNGEFYLVRVLRPVNAGGHLLADLLLAPRYVGVSMDQVMSGTSVVNILLITRGPEAQVGGAFLWDDSLFWAIGESRVKDL